MLLFKFTPSPNDFTRACWTFYLSNWIRWTILILTTAILGACGITIFVTDSASGYLAMILLFLSLVLASFLLFLLLISPYMAGRRIQNDERLNSPIEYQASEEYFLFRNRFSETKLDWGSFNRVIESPELFLLIYSVNKNMFQFIPKRAFTSDADEQAFQSLLKAKISGSYSKGVTIRVPPIVTVLLGIFLGIGTLLCVIVSFFMILIMRH